MGGRTRSHALGRPAKALLSSEPALTSEAAMRLSLGEQPRGLDRDDADEKDERQHLLVVDPPIATDHVLHDPDHEATDDHAAQAAEATQDGGVEAAEHDEEAE